jgi:ATP synthase protein I
MVVTAPVIILVFWFTGQSRGGLAALFGVVIALIFFAGGLYIMGRITNASPISVLVGALAVYLGQVIFLGVVMVSFSGAAWLDGKAFGLSILAVALIWQVAQVVAFLRLRKPVFDLPAAVPQNAAENDPADETARRPTL